ncbi:hypothetical protein GQX74_012391 [Glossina fuscipes]|nr:hypothetical protein GQX74_012391 [Glossina fuscipes]
MQVQVPEHVVSLYVATYGQNGPGLGSDEKEIILLVYVILEATTGQTIVVVIAGSLQGDTVTAAESLDGRANVCHILDKRVRSSFNCYTALRVMSKNILKSIKINDLLLYSAVWEEISRIKPRMTRRTSQSNGEFP